nr:hypothetical protein [Okeania sp. SIO2F4]
MQEKIAEVKAQIGTIMNAVTQAHKAMNETDQNKNKYTVLGK